VVWSFQRLAYTRPIATLTVDRVEVLDNKFELVRLIGEGGMGTVYEARNIRSGRRVAIKRMSDGVARDPASVQRFVREAQASTAIEHPGVVQVFDVGASGGAPYMVMELLAGEPLSAFIAREAPVAPVRLATLLGPALGALACAHALGIVHRDLKPDNVFLARPPGTGEIVPKLLDFGISKVLVDGAGLGLTRTGAVLGTPYYMSPEQAAGQRDVDARADIYALGAIFYQALTGRVPYDADNYNALIVAILSRAPVSMRHYVPGLSPEVEAVIAQAMSHNRASRHTTVAQFVHALAAALGESAVLARAMLPSGEVAVGARTFVGAVITAPAPPTAATRVDDAASTGAPVPQPTVLSTQTPLVHVTTTPATTPAPNPPRRASGAVALLAWVLATGGATGGYLARHRGSSAARATAVGTARRPEAPVVVAPRPLPPVAPAAPRVVVPRSPIAPPPVAPVPGPSSVAAAPVAPVPPRRETPDSRVFIPRARNRAARPSAPAYAPGPVAPVYSTPPPVPPSTSRHRAGSLNETDF
jgi:serine/threonine-protein kinase